MPRYTDEENEMISRQLKREREKMFKKKYSKAPPSKKPVGKLDPVRWDVFDNCQYSKV